MYYLKLSMGSFLANGGGYSMIITGHPVIMVVMPVVVVLKKAAHIPFGESGSSSKNESAASTMDGQLTWQGYSEKMA